MSTLRAMRPGQRSDARLRHHPDESQVGCSGIIGYAKEAIGKWILSQPKFRRRKLPPFDILWRALHCSVSDLKTKYAHIIFCVFFAIVTIAWTATISSYKLEWPDAFDYAQMGRQISSRNGFSTLQLFPRHIPYLHAHGYLGADPAPNLYRYPLTPLANAAVLFLIPDPERAAVIQSGIWFLLSIPLLYILALEFASSWIALLCVAIYVPQSLSWGTGHDGLTQSLATLLILIVAYLTFSSKQSRTTAFALGAAAGSAYLCRTQLAYLLPWSILFLRFLAKGPKRGSLIGLAFLGAFVALAPWLIRNVIVTGSPFFSFSSTRNLVEDTGSMLSDIELQLTAPVALADILSQNGKAIFWKIIYNLWPNILNPMAITASRLYGVLLIISILALIFMLWRTRGQQLARFIIFSVGTLLLVIVNFCISILLRPDPHYLMLLDPLIIIVGVQSAVVLMHGVLGGRNAQRAVAIFWLPAVSICAAFFAIRVGEKPVSEIAASRDKESYQLLAALARNNATVASDESYKTALYARLQSIRLPSEPSELFKIDESYLPIEYVVLSARLIRESESATNRSIGYDRYLTFRTSQQFLDKYFFEGELPNGAELYRKR